jgi:hypothetical protein
MASGQALDVSSPDLAAPPAGAALFSWAASGRARQPDQDGRAASGGAGRLLEGDPRGGHRLGHVITPAGAGKAIELDANTQQHHRSPDDHATHRH